MANIILFDGVCNLCNSSVQFIIKWDPNGYFSFAPLQEEAGKKLLATHHIKTNMDSLILISNNTFYQKSSAALEICRHLQGGWKLLYAFKLIPRFIRDPLYTYIAKNRYKWFGKKTSCMIPTAENKKRFL